MGHKKRPSNKLKGLLLLALKFHNVRQLIPILCFSQKNEEYPNLWLLTLLKRGDCI